MLIKKIKNFIENPKLLLFYLDRKKLFKMKDEEYLKINYKKVFNDQLNLKKPQTFNEKLQWLKLYDRKKIYTTMVDKYEVKKYVENKIGNEFIIPTIGIYNKFDDINFNKLPNQYVIKCTHDSGGVYICSNNKNFEISNIKKKINKSLKKNFYKQGREWPYKNIKPKIIIENYMGENLNDYKFFCFNGIPKYILVCSNRKDNFKNTDFYDENWNLMPFTRANHHNNPNGIKKPKNLKKMLEIANILSKDIPFVRVDLYEINNKIYFGELTFFPSAGFEGFYPKEWDKKLGELLTLPKEKTNEK